MFITFIKIVYFYNIWPTQLNRQVWEILLEDLTIDILTFTSFSVFILYSTSYFFFKEYNGFIIISFHLFFSFVSSLIAHVLDVVSSLSFGSITIDTIFNYNHITAVFRDVDRNFFLYFSILSIAYIYHYYKQYRVAEFERVETNHKLTIANLNLIQSQLEPHLLFNTLNSISSLVYSDKDKAVKTITNLGDILRATLMLRDTQFISVKEEISYLSNYIEILNLKFNDRIILREKINKETIDKKIPSLILQPIIENAVKHGLNDSNTDLEILLFTDIDKEGKLVIDIKNSGSKINPKADFNKENLKKGLSLVKQRLSLIYKKGFTFDIQNLDDPIFNVGVKIVIDEPKIDLLKYN